MKNKTKHLKAEIKYALKNESIRRAKNNAFTFSVSEEIWLLDHKFPVDLLWLHEIDIPLEHKTSFLKALATRAEDIEPVTFKSQAMSLKYIAKYIEIEAFKMQWATLKESVKKRLKSFFSGVDVEIDFPSFRLIKDFMSKWSYKTTSSPLEPNKGAYTNFEYDEIHKAMKIVTDINAELLNQEESLTAEVFVSLSKFIMSTFLLSIVRRPSQIRDLKWCDLLPVGSSFNDESIQDEPILKDIDSLMLRTFKGKQGGFREYAELRPHILTHKLSLLLVAYRIQYQKVLSDKLLKDNIILTDIEMADLISRLPIIPDSSIFKLIYANKRKLLKAFSVQSKSGHLTLSNAKYSISSFYRYTLKKYIDPMLSNKKGFNFSNNRIRHTVIMEAARNGYERDTIAALTGVTVAAIKQAYLNLDAESRFDVDKKTSSNEVLKNFSSISVSQLRKNPEFIVKSEFDEEIGQLQSHKNCNQCNAKMGAPISCYGCSNFTAFIEADHHTYLKKAERKLDINKNNGASRQTLKVLRNNIGFIEATILACEEAKNLKLDTTNECN